MHSLLMSVRAFPAGFRLSSNALLALRSQPGSLSALLRTGFLSIFWVLSWINTYSQTADDQTTDIDAED